MFLWNPDSGKNFLPEFGILGFEIQNAAQGSRIPRTINTWNPESTDKDWNSVPGFRNPRRGIQSPRLSLMTLHGTSWHIVSFQRPTVKIFFSFSLPPLSNVLPLNMRPETRLTEDTNTNCKSLRAEQRKRYFVTGKVSGK